MIRVNVRRADPPPTFWGGVLFCKAAVAAGVGVGLLWAAGCGVPAGEADPAPPTLYEGAFLIPGDGSQPIADASFLVEDGVIMRIGRAGQLRLTREVRRVDLTGRTVMPALIAAHAHPGFQRGLEYAAEHHSRETLLEDLERAAHFGVGTVLSLGIDPGGVAFEVRRETAGGEGSAARLLTAGRGIGAPNAGPGLAALARGIAYEVTTAGEARGAVRELGAAGVDQVKIWVDDRGGRAPTLEPAVYRAIIDEARRHELHVIAHVYYHDDAVDLVEAGVHALAHLPRDEVVSDELAESIVARGVYVMPNLGFTERGTHAGVPPWEDNARFVAMLEATTAPEVVDRMHRAFADRSVEAAAATRARYEILERSVGRLHAAGARIVMGADSGLPDHFVGPAEQREMELMVAAGMSEAAVIEAATGRAGRYLGRADEGSLRAGNRADFLVLEANPLDDIRNTRRIEAVVLNGIEVPR